MENGTYTCPERVERNGRLVAFSGEVMTMAEAERRGLVEKPVSDDDDGKPKKPSKDDLLARCKDMGIEVPAKATKADIEKLIADRGSDADSSDQNSDGGNGGDPEDGSGGDGGDE